MFYEQSYKCAYCLSLHLCSIQITLLRKIDKKPAKDPTIRKTIDIVQLHPNDDHCFCNIVEYQSMRIGTDFCK